MDELTDGPLLARREGATLLVTINRPEARNALNEDVLGRLRAMLDAVVLDPDLRAVVFTGAGERAFCAGADIRHMQGMSREDGREWARLGHDVFEAVEDLPLPTVAAINGAALGGGCELTLACDYRVMADTALIGQPEIKLGLIPGWGGTQRLPRLIGPAAAKDLVLTGRLAKAEEALRLGLVNRVAPAGAVLDEALAYAAQFAGAPPVAVAFAKRAIRLGAGLDLPEANALEVTLFTECFGTDDRHEGIAAFLEKRPPAFKGK